MNMKVSLTVAVGIVFLGSHVARADDAVGAEVNQAPMPPAKLFAKPEDAPYAATPLTAPCNTLYGTRGDPSKQAATFLTRMTTGCIVSWHWHHATEEVVILKGTAVAQMKGGKPVTLKPASYSQLPAMHTHRFRCASKETCYIFVVGDGPFDINYVTEDGKPMTTAESLALIEKVGHSGW
jgi:quercetin dioxygenase-like cupin family protein